MPLYWYVLMTMCICIHSELIRVYTYVCICTDTNLHTHLWVKNPSNSKSAYQEWPTSLSNYFALFCIFFISQWEPRFDFRNNICSSSKRRHSPVPQVVKEESQSHPISHRQILGTQPSWGERKMKHGFWVQPSFPIKSLMGTGTVFPISEFPGPA